MSLIETLRPESDAKSNNSLLFSEAYREETVNLNLYDADPILKAKSYNLLLFPEAYREK
jgi:hypothetical protein